MPSTTEGTTYDRHHWRSSVRRRQVHFENLWSTKPRLTLWISAKLLRSTTPRAILHLPLRASVGLTGLVQTGPAPGLRTYARKAHPNASCEGCRLIGELARDSAPRQRIAQLLQPRVRNLGTGQIQRLQAFESSQLFQPRVCHLRSAKI